MFIVQHKSEACIFASLYGFLILGLILPARYAAGASFASTTSSTGAPAIAHSTGSVNQSSLASPSGTTNQTSPGSPTSSLDSAGMPQGDATVVAAMIAVAGVIATAIVSLVVGLVGHCLSKRLGERTAAIHSADQERLKLDTFINAVGLMSTASGEEVSESQLASSLFVLAKLDQLDFALTLLGPLWSSGKISSSSASWLLDLSLRSHETDIQNSAASILCDNATRLLRQPEGYDWPSCIDGKWNLDLTVPARGRILLALIKLVMGRPRSEWLPSYWLATPLADLYGIAIHDTDGGIRIGATEAGIVILDALERLNGPNMDIRLSLGVWTTVTKLREDLKDRYTKLHQAAMAPSDWIRDAIADLRNWAK